jgi:hypothetical protein
VQVAFLGSIAAMSARPRDPRPVLPGRPGLRACRGSQRPAAARASGQEAAVGQGLAQGAGVAPEGVGVVLHAARGEAFGQRGDAVLASAFSRGVAM